MSQSVFCHILGNSFSKLLAGYKLLKALQFSLPIWTYVRDCFHHCWHCLLVWVRPMQPPVGLAFTRPAFEGLSVDCRGRRSQWRHSFLEGLSQSTKKPTIFLPTKPLKIEVLLQIKNFFHNHHKFKISKFLSKAEIRRKMNEYFQSCLDRERSHSRPYGPEPPALAMAETEGWERSWISVLERKGAKRHLLSWEASWKLGKGVASAQLCLA